VKSSSPLPTAGIGDCDLPGTGTTSSSRETSLLIKVLEMSTLASGSDMLVCCFNLRFVVDRT
jgi:hypothetical protein